MNDIIKFIITAGLIIFFMVVIVLLINSMPQQTEQDKRNEYLKWHSDEVKYCQSKGLEFNDTFTINNCYFIRCFNETGIGTYQFCNTRNNNDGSFLDGFLVGWLVFSN